MKLRYLRALLNGSSASSICARSCSAFAAMSGVTAIDAANEMYSASMWAAPLQASGRAIAPPRWRISAVRMSEPLSAPLAATNASIASAGSVAIATWCSPLPGTGPGGSMCRWMSASVGISPKVSIAGSRSRSALTTSSPERWSPMWITSTIANVLAAERLRDLLERRDAQDAADARGAVVDALA